MKLGLGIKASLSQTLTPQQIQYLKLLQLPIMQLEQHVRQEIEMNPMLEDESDSYDDFELISLQQQNEDNYEVDRNELETEYESANIEDSEFLSEKLFIDDKPEPFEFQTMVMDSSYYEDVYNPNKSSDDDDYEPFQIKDNQNFFEDLKSQLSLFKFTPEQKILSEQILGNIDYDGYLRRELEEIVDETNEMISELNFEGTYSNILEGKFDHEEIIEEFSNPANNFKLDQNSSNSLLNSLKLLNGDASEEISTNSNIEKEIKSNANNLKLVKISDAEFVLSHIKQLDPPGIGSRDIQECLLAQLAVKKRLNPAQKLAKEILENYYDAFTKKHFHVITKQLEVGEDYLKEAIDEIRSLNPKPGGLDYQSETNTVIPDFLVYRSEDNGEILIEVNDQRIPTLQLSKTYDNMRKELEYKEFNKDTKDWLRQKREDAKFMIQALRQRKLTMLKVMTAIAHLQQDFFYYGSSALKPLIYKDVSEHTGLDISTVCRIVNGKYVQTSFGTFELKYFFSESLSSDEGEEISTKVIKEALKNIIDQEKKNKPHSDDKLSKELKKIGYNVARRTVAKYREQLNIPVARLRKELV